MKLPSITLVLRGYKDRYDRQYIYMRYAYAYQTNYIASKWKVRKDEFDTKTQSVKNNAWGGGASPVRINSDLNTWRAKAFSLLADSAAAGKPLDFTSFKERFTDLYNGRVILSIAAKKVLDAEFSASQISGETRRSYLAAIKKFEYLMGETEVTTINRAKVLIFKSKTIELHNENLAAQYVRNIGIVYRKIVKSYGLPKSVDPFLDISNNVKRISEKKTLTDQEFNELQMAFNRLDPGDENFETLRRFIFMCRGGIRWFDTNLIERKDFVDIKIEDREYRYFRKPAKKTNRAGIIPILPSDIGRLIIWQDDGFLFKKVSYQRYLINLKNITSKIIHREISTHYARHRAGDTIINADMGNIDDVKLVLGLSKDNIAELYAKRDIIKLLDKFYPIIDNLTT